MNEETWSPIAGYPDYAISDRGVVVNVKLNRIVEGRRHGNQIRVVLKNEDGYRHEQNVSRLLSMVNFDQAPPIQRRLIRVVETNEVYETVEDAAKGLYTDKSSVYRALRGSRPRVMGKTVEYFYG